MRRAAALLLAAAFALGAPAFVGAAQTALASTTLNLDLDGDGVPDRVTLTQGNGEAIVRVAFAARSHPAQRFSFPVDPGREDAVCALPVRLRAESLDYDPAPALGAALEGFVRSKTAHGFALVDERCDAIHFYWNHRTRRLAWWRA
ncbi:MAG TPA: hypothetical protein VMH02_13220 [Verrucomicrobiae bacterium]|nr:hypothetical protein [Verrucomicrobiae bacterium]